MADLQKQLATLETVLAEMQKVLGLGDGSTVTNVINTAQISCQVVSGQLHILGATKLIAAGYVPYLFRLTRKRNQYHHKPQYRTTADAVSVVAIIIAGAQKKVKVLSYIDCQRQVREDMSLIFRNFAE